MNGYGFWWLAAGWGGLGFVAHGQAPLAATALSTSNAQQQVLASGKPKRGYFFSVGPGSGYALRFTAAAPGRSVSSLGLYFQPFGRDTARVPVRVRLASVAAAGGPADDDLLPAALVLSPATLQANKRGHLVLSWPVGQVAVPASGFFVVIEGIGNSPDEYVAGVVRSWALSATGAYQIARRQQPGAPPRLLPNLSILLLRSARPAATVAACWMQGGAQPSWQQANKHDGVPLLEINLQ